MTMSPGQYLEDVRDNLRLDLVSEAEVISELRAHIEDKLEEMKEAGLSEEEATDTCLELLGSSRVVARQMYEAHSQGTWKQALMAALPHLLFALVFALDWWRGIGWLAIVLGLVLVTAVYSWWHGRPVWSFTWLGYSLLPLLMVGLFLFYLPRGWPWLAVPVYVPLALWFFCSISVQVIKRDWLYSALMLLPVPIIFDWFMAVSKAGEFARISSENVQQFAPWIGLSFSILAITAVLFIRVRQRWIRGTLLLISGLVVLAMVAFYTEGSLSFPIFLMLIIVTVGFLLTPALFERKIRHIKHRAVS